MKPIAIVVGTRPELIKVYSVVKELERLKANFVLISTGQQEELLSQTAQSLKIEFDYWMKSRSSNADLLDFFGASVIELSLILKKISPSRVVVHGDTTSTLIGATCAYLLRIQLSHIESGLRTKNLQNPWPEEGIRRMVDAISDQLFTPTLEDLDNLKLDSNQKAFLTGNTGVDLALKFGERVLPQVRFEYRPRILLVTLHRRESHNLQIQSMLEELVDMSYVEDLKIEVVLHPNPVVTKTIEELLSNKNVLILQPLGFLEMMTKLRSVWSCVTDSGGLALECISLGIPVGILRDFTEESEVLEAGSAKLIGRSRGAIKNFIQEISEFSNFYRYSNSQNPLGDGLAWSRIVPELLKPTQDF